MSWILQILRIVGKNEYCCHSSNHSVRSVCHCRIMPWLIQFCDPKFLLTCLSAMKPILNQVPLINWMIVWLNVHAKVHVCADSLLNFIHSHSNSLYNNCKINVKLHGLIHSLLVLFCNLVHSCFHCIHCVANVSAREHQSTSNFECNWLAYH